ncbi:hypothetical protein [Paenibacillus phytohabitans]|uniref:hypothetical protein n=1 Tax=Paenibacillus phytohabitans TaxID=2654978 RepID=UPI0014918BE2|nr:hypothetical protein [Paenibacillus phytohabitans]
MAKRLAEVANGWAEVGERLAEAGEWLVARSKEAISLPYGRESPLLLLFRKL